MLGWSELRGNAPDLLDPISPVVQRADLGEDIGTVYRLRTTSTAKEDATALCGELRRGASTAWWSRMRRMKPKTGHAPARRGGFARSDPQPARDE